MTFAPANVTPVDLMTKGALEDEVAPKTSTKFGLSFPEGVSKTTSGSEFERYGFRVVEVPVNITSADDPVEVGNTANLVNVNLLAVDDESGNIEDMKFLVVDRATWDNNSNNSSIYKRITVAPLRAWETSGTAVASGKVSPTPKAASWLTTYSTYLISSKKTRLS